MKIGLMEVKQALLDHRFRDTLPIEMKEDVAKYLQNPGCPCNVPIYKKILKEAAKNLKDYYPGKEIDYKEENILSKNNWTVINCHINELAGRLQQLPVGRKQVAVTRYEDQVTAVINELEMI